MSPRVSRTLPTVEPILLTPHRLRPIGIRLQGDPAKAGPFTVRVDMPPDYAVRPHHHPSSEELRLLEGTLHLGHGAKWDEQAMKGMVADKPVTMGAKEPHFLHAANRVVLEETWMLPGEVRGTRASAGTQSQTSPSGPLASESRRGPYGRLWGW